MRGGFAADKVPRKPKPTRCINLVYDYLLAENPEKASKPSNASCLCTSASVGPAGGFTEFAIMPLRPSIGWLGASWIAPRSTPGRCWPTRSRTGVAKYIAIARRLLGEIAAVNGDATTAEEELTRSLEPFATHPMPLIEWRNHAALGRLLAARNRPGGAREAFKRAETLVRELAGNISDPAPRKVFLEMDAVREVIAGAAG